MISEKTLRSGFSSLSAFLKESLSVSSSLFPNALFIVNSNLSVSGGFDKRLI